MAHWHQQPLKQVVPLLRRREITGDRDIAELPVYPQVSGDYVIGLSVTPTGTSWWVDPSGMYYQGVET